MNTLDVPDSMYFVMFTSGWMVLTNSWTASIALDTACMNIEQVATCLEVIRP